MQMNRQRRDIDIFAIAILVSFVLSAWHVLANPIPNSDAFDYVRTATVYLDSGIAAAFSWDPTATYPVVMGMVHQVTGLNLFAAGQFINAVFYGLIIYAFMSIALEVRNTRRIALISAALILVFPTLNEYRYYLIRDIGFLAFMLLAALQLMRYYKQAHSLHACAFIALVFAATLLRTEALAYLPLAPLALLAGPQRQWRAFLKVELFLLGIGVSALAVFFVLNIDVIEILQRVLTVYWPFLHDALIAFTDKNSPLSIAVFGEYAANFSGKYIWLFMFAGLSAVLLAQLLSGLGVPTLLLVIYGLAQQRREFAQNNIRTLLVFALISFAILLVFLGLTRFISTRYTMLFSLSLLAILPVVIDNMLVQIETLKRRNWAKGALVFFLLFSAIDAHISFGDSRDSLQEASDWLLANTQEGDAIFTNSSYIAYYSGRVENYDEVSRYITEHTIENAQYGTVIALMMSSSIEQQLQHNLEFQQLEALAAFPNEQDPEVLIYRRLGN